MRVVETAHPFSKRAALNPKSDKTRTPDGARMMADVVDSRSSFASNTLQAMPSFLRHSAAVKPAMPPPQTITFILIWLMINRFQVKLKDEKCTKKTNKQMEHLTQTLRSEFHMFFCSTNQDRRVLSWNSDRVSILVCRTVYQNFYTHSLSSLTTYQLLFLFVLDHRGSWLDGWEHHIHIRCKPMCLMSRGVSQRGMSSVGRPSLKK